MARVQVVMEQKSNLGLLTLPRFRKTVVEGGDGWNLVGIRLEQHKLG